MKTLAYLCLTFGLFLVSAVVERPETAKPNPYDTPVASIVKGKIQINKKALSRKSAGGFKVLEYRVIWSKNKKYYYLIQSFQTSKTKVNRFIPLERNGNTLNVCCDPPERDWIDCMLMRCSTCEEEISGSGSAYCACSVGGCDQEDTSEPEEEIMAKLFD